MAKRFSRSAATGRYVTTKANQRAAAKVYVAASEKAGKSVPASVRKMASSKEQG